MSEPEAREHITSKTPTTLDTRLSLVVGGFVVTVAILAYVIVIGSGDMRSDTVTNTADRANSADDSGDDATEGN